MTSAQPTPQLPAPNAPNDSSAPSQPATGAAPAAPTGLPATKLTADESAALQLALDSENAAIWAYALVAANDPAEADTVAAMRAAHLMVRDATASRLIAGGAQPVAPSPAYAVPPVTDTPSARGLAVKIETDCCGAWYSLVGHTDRADLRAYGAAALAQSAVRTTQWKKLAKASKLTVPFPGEPT